MEESSGRVPWVAVKQWILDSDQWAVRRASFAPLKASKQTHRMLAWGVLGSASDGLPFLLTHPVVFRSICNDQTPELDEVPSRFVKLCNFRQGGETIAGRQSKRQSHAGSPHG